MSMRLQTSIWMFSDPTVLYSERYIGNTEIDAVASTAVDVQDTIGGFASASGNLVTSGQMRQRLSRRNTIPIFLLWCLFCIIWAFSSTLGRALVSFVQTVICCGRFDNCLNMLCCQGERAPILTNPPYNGPYAARIEPSKLHRLVRARRSKCRQRCACTVGFGQLLLSDPSPLACVSVACSPTRRLSMVCASGAIPRTASGCASSYGAATTTPSRAASARSRT